ncbi:hypothetical protein [Paenibacillus glucanolyticus]|uniref:hypothetical protein n=1 Tax=Paenibacillus glucanolyticus TaxID=59843 RepID=UPI00096D5D6C|nr:hypothetical protein [Paenibacillus glucanolyticus]OMF69692.1 hypothetical protein BK142_25220 [Paenibacillus glucanolyticus]
MNPTTNNISIHDLAAPPSKFARQWRVGTLSMGLSLLILGLLVLSSAWKGVEVYSSAVRWWPIVFVLLGTEIVVYTLIFRKQDTVRYDMFSILLIGFLIFCCIGMAALSATGLMEQIRRETMAIQQTIPIPDQKVAIPDGVKKVIVQGSYNHNIRQDVSSADEMLIFGSLRTEDSDIWSQAELPALIQIKQSGNILYVQLNDPPRYSFRGSSSWFDVTVSVPASVKVVVRDRSS